MIGFLTRSAHAGVRLLILSRSMMQSVRLGSRGGVEGRGRGRMRESGKREEEEESEERGGGE